MNMKQETDSFFSVISVVISESKKSNAHLYIVWKSDNLSFLKDKRLYIYSFKNPFNLIQNWAEAIRKLILLILMYFFRSVILKQNDMRKPIYCLPTYYQHHQNFGIQTKERRMRHSTYQKPRHLVLYLQFEMSVLRIVKSTTNHL